MPHLKMSKPIENLEEIIERIIDLEQFENRIDKIIQLEIPEDKINKITKRK